MCNVDGLPPRPYLAGQVPAALYNLLLLHHQPPPLESAPRLCSRINAEVKSARKTVNPSRHGTQWSSCGRKTAAAAAEAAAAVTVTITAAALTHNCHSLLYKVAIVNNDMSEMYFFFLKYFLLPPLGQSDMFWWFFDHEHVSKGGFLDWVFFFFLTALLNLKLENLIIPSFTHFFL